MKYPIVRYDPDADAIAVRLNGGRYARTEELDDSRNIDYEQKNPAARDVAEKFVTKSETTMRVFNQTGNVCYRCPPIFGKFHYADDWMQSRERIGRNFRPGGGNFSEQGRFAGVRIADKPGISDRTQFKQEVPSLAFFAFGVFARCPIARTFEMHIPLPTRAAATKDKLLTVARKIDKWFDC